MFCLGMGKPMRSAPPCVGPCLTHCYRCSPVTVGFAYLALGYLITSVVYLLWTALAAWGTPFLDSLTPEQRVVLESSKAQRRAAFLVGTLVATVVLCVLRPFSRHAT